MPSSSDLPEGTYYLVKQQKGEKEVSMINSTLYSIMRYYRIDALPFNTDIEIVLDCPFGSYHGFCPSKFTIRKVNDNMVKVTPVDYLNTILDSRLVKNNRLSEPVTKVMELVQATKKTVKEFSTTEPTFDNDQLCKYSLTLEGITVEDIFHQINKMYLDAISQTSLEYSTLRKLYSVRKQS